MKRILCSLLVTAVLSGAAFAQTAPQPIVAPVMQKDLADMPGREMLMLSVEYPPGAVEHIHRHDAYAFVYVLEGTIVEGVRGLKNPLICQTGPKPSANSGWSCSIWEKRCISGPSHSSRIVGSRS